MHIIDIHCAVCSSVHNNEFIKFRIDHPKKETSGKRIRNLLETSGKSTEMPLVAS